MENCKWGGWLGMAHVPPGCSPGFLLLLLLLFLLLLPFLLFLLLPLLPAMAPGF